MSLFRAASESRPYHLGRFPLEVLARDPSLWEREADRPPLVRGETEALPGGGSGFRAALAKYHDLFLEQAHGQPASAKAPVPDNPERRAMDVKGGAIFLNASQVAICSMAANAWIRGEEIEGHRFAVVILMEHGRLPEAGNPARQIVEGGVGESAALLAAEIALSVAGHIRCMGFEATAHTTRTGSVDLERLAVMAGLAVRREEGLWNPFLDNRFELAVVTTDYELATDTPLKQHQNWPGGFSYWWGINGAESGAERNRRNRRATHLSRYPMEQVKRVERPTTLILDDEVPRVPKRAAFFERALRGDLGEKSRKERGRFALKHPFAMSMAQLIRSLVPHQDGPTAETQVEGLDDPAANARAVKSLSYLLGADLTGICEVPDYAWFSHHADGTPLEPYHKYAIVMLIDQEYETMEGASGDDWISGAQSMRGYMRGAEIAGIMADTLRDLGHSSRPQTNLDSDVLHIPLVLWAGLGELSRIGELVLNPFVGPRFKSVVVTTDMPLEVDKPVDFGLQYFCDNCLKCARECPCDAIPWGDKVMFNGYEMWKPDVERCTRYRLTNMKGAACGRCMKTCPLNKVISSDGPLLTRAASWMGVNAMWAKPALVPLAVKLDDKLGNGRRNPVKKWWFDLEIVDGVCVAPPRGTNEREIEPEKETRMQPEKQKIAYYPANVMPSPDNLEPVHLDRKAGLAAAEALETPLEALARKAVDGAMPDHYRPVSSNLD